MDNMVLYIFQVILFQAVFLMAYRIWLHRETHFNLNRVYLLLTPALAMLLPFVDFDVFDAATQPVNRYIHELPEVFLGAGEAAATQVEELPTITLNAGRDLFEPEMFFPLAYILGMLGSVLLFARKYNSITRYFRFKRKDDKSIIHIPNSTTAFTFFNTIFLGEKIDALSRKQILKHEQVHVSQKHGLDLLFFEFLKVAMWFNPMVYAYQKTIAELHEFIADDKAASGEKKDYLNQLLNTAFGTQQVSFINTFFNHSLTKKRIVMLQSKSRSAALAKYLLILPLVAGMLFIASCTQDDKMAQNTQNQSLEEQIADLQAAIEAKETLTETETKGLMKLGVDGYTKGNNLKKPWEQTDADIHVVDDDELNNGKILTETEVVADPSKEATPLNEAIIEEQELEDIPFAIVDKTPIYPGCENLDNATAKDCFAQKVTKFVSDNYDSDKMKPFAEEGVNRVYVRFEIDKNGNIADVGTRAHAPQLEAEARRVITALPKMQPGIFKGRKINTLYSLPIVFKK